MTVIGNLVARAGTDPRKCSSQYAVLKNNQNNQEQKHGIRRCEVIIWKELVNSWD